MSLEIELPWTGERLVPTHVGDTAIEHLHRYAFAREYAQGMHVLDIACGEGYGAHLLSRVAASVIGIDISDEVISHARSRYGDAVTFAVGACTSIPLPDACVDVVVSFETLEHLAEHEEMLRQIKRVLRPGGVMILSTPDKLNYTTRPEVHNPFHVRELSTREFRQLVGSFFSHTSLFQQRVCQGSILAPSTDLPISGFRHYLGDFSRLRYSDGITDPMYNIAVATDNASRLEHRVSLFNGWDIPTELEKNLSEARAAYDAEVGKHDRQLSELQEVDRQLQEVNRQQQEELNKQLQDMQAAHAAERNAWRDSQATHSETLAQLRNQLVDVELDYVGAIWQLQTELADRKADHAKAIGDLADQLSTAAEEVDILRQRLNKFPHRAVDRAAMLTHQFERILLFFRSAVHMVTRLLRTRT